MNNLPLHKSREEAMKLAFIDIMKARSSEKMFEESVLLDIMEYNDTILLNDSIDISCCQTYKWKKNKKIK